MSDDFWQSSSSSSSSSFCCWLSIILFFLFNPDVIPFWLPIRWYINGFRASLGWSIKGGESSSDFSMSDISDS
jgi:hypothetical protein